MCLLLLSICKDDDDDDNDDNDDDMVAVGGWWLVVVMAVGGDCLFTSIDKMVDIIIVAPQYVATNQTVWQLLDTF